MPKEMTHWIIAGKALNRIDESGKIFKILSSGENLYYLGAVLPDTPAYLITGKDKKTVQALDREFHDPAGSSLAPAASLVQKYGESVPPEIMALLAGTITHIITDSVFHPFVFYYCGHDTQKHYRLETYIDLYFMSLYKEKFKSFRKILKNVETDIETVSDFMSLYFDRESSLKKNSYRKSLHQHALIQNAWFKPLLRKTSRGFNLIPGINLNQKLELFYPSGLKNKIFQDEYSYRDPVTGEKKRTTITDLAEEAIRRITIILQGLDEISNPEKISKYLLSIKGPNPLTGIEGIKSDEMKFFSEIKDIDEVIFR
jgi:hypothetical protein